MSELHLSVGQVNQTQQLIAELRGERSAVWRLYCQITEMNPLFNTDNIRPVLSSFSQLLIDYISLGHFGVYRHVLADPRCEPSAIDFAERIYPQFANTTASAISFNDQYDNGKRNFKTDNLAKDLSVLGESLVKRMELEDRLCLMLAGQSNQQAA